MTAYTSKKLQNPVTVINLDGREYNSQTLISLGRGHYPRDLKPYLMGWKEA